MTEQYRDPKHWEVDNQIEVNIEGVSIKRHIDQLLRKTVVPRVTVSLQSLPAKGRQTKTFRTFSYLSSHCPLSLKHLTTLEKQTTFSITPTTLCTFQRSASISARLSPKMNVGAKILANYKIHISLFT